jgi:putative intracellular protease/amidase
MSKKALILTYEKFQDHEVIYPYYRLTEDDFQVDIV